MIKELFNLFFIKKKLGILDNLKKDFLRYKSWNNHFLLSILINFIKYSIKNKKKFVDIFIKKLVFLYF